ncbi:MAG: aminotransferase class V-fold PLP-dependent enzyme, partial [Pseudomonadota bacterium]
RRFENWESFVAGRVGLTEAVRYARKIGLSKIEARVADLAQDLRDALSDIDGISVHDLGRKKCGIVTFTKDGSEPLSIADSFRAQAINVSVSPMTSARLDLEPRNLNALVRASVHYFNTHDEISRFVDAARKA